MQMAQGRIAYFCPTIYENKGLKGGQGVHIVNPNKINNSDVNVLLLKFYF